MAESITISFADRQVGIQYHSQTPEATMRDEMIARELALNALAVQAITHRINHGLPVPPVLAAIVEARTFHDLF